MMNLIMRITAIYILFSFTFNCISLGMLYFAPAEITQQLTQSNVNWLIFQTCLMGVFLKMAWNVVMEPYRKLKESMKPSDEEHEEAIKKVANEFTREAQLHDEEFELMIKDQLTEIVDHSRKNFESNVNSEAGIKELKESLELDDDDEDEINLQIKIMKPDYSSEEFDFMVGYIKVNMIDITRSLNPEDILLIFTEAVQIIIAKRTKLEEDAKEEYEEIKTYIKKIIEIGVIHKNKYHIGDAK